jgi:hypothetical protein
VRENATARLLFQKEAVVNSVQMNVARACVVGLLFVGGLLDLPYKLGEVLGE